MATIKNAIAVFVYVLNMLILVRCIISWLPISKRSPIVQLVYALTEPILGPIRSAIDRSPLGGPGMMLDFSPMLAILLLNAVSRLLTSFL